MDKRKVAHKFKKDYEKYSKVLLLCSEPTPKYCHRRLISVVDGFCYLFCLIFSDRSMYMQQKLR